MEQRRDRHQCAICGEQVNRNSGHDTLCDRCEEAWKREVDCAW